MADDEVSLEKKADDAAMEAAADVAAMDAIVLLENMQVDVRVKLEGRGVVKAQSLSENEKLKSNQTIVLKAS